MKPDFNSICSGLTVIVSTGLLFVFWIFFAVFLPMSSPYNQWVADSDWFWVNSIGFTGSLFGVFAFQQFYSCKHSKTPFSLLLYLSGQIGIVILTCLLFFETFILKGIVIQNPDLVQLNHGFYTYTPFRLINIIGGGLFSIGTVGVSLSMMKDRSFKKWKLILLSCGAPLFGLVFVPGNLRLVGLLLYAIAYISIGLEMIKMTHKEL